jgi:hypothetical protein
MSTIISNMEAMASATSVPVVHYSAPEGHWTKTFVALMLVEIISCGIASLIIWLGIIPQTWHSTTAPVWAHLAGGAGLMFITVVLVAWGRRELLSQITMSADGFALRGWINGGKFSYDDVRLITLSMNPKDGLPRLRLAVDFTRKSRRMIWLPSTDAKECFEAMRGLCEHAPAIGLSDQIQLPRNPSFRTDGLLTLSRVFRRRASVCLFGSIACLGMAAFLASFWLAAKTPSYTQTPKYAFGVITYIVFSVVLIVRAISDFRAAYSVDISVSVV